MLIELLEGSGQEAVELFESLDPMGAAPFAVSWAGENASLVWFDLAREYTERWHHQRQIVDAVGKPSPIDGRRLYHPVLDTFMRALPYTFREIQAEDGTLVVVEIGGKPAGPGNCSGGQAPGFLSSNRAERRVPSCDSARIPPGGSSRSGWTPPPQEPASPTSQSAAIPLSAIRSSRWCRSWRDPKPHHTASCASCDRMRDEIFA